jgi:hypothetical protein
LFLFFYILPYTDFYLFVLWYSLSFSFLYHFVPILYSTIGSWCLLALHMVYWPRWGTKYPLLLLYIWIICLLIKYCTFFCFLPPTLLMWVLLYILLSHLIEFLLSCSVSSKLHWNHTTETFHHPHSFLYKLRFGTAGFLLDSWPPEDRTKTLSRDIDNKLPLLTV